jgi:hypothetical protein
MHESQHSNMKKQDNMTPPKVSNWFQGYWSTWNDSKNSKEWVQKWLMKSKKIQIAKLNKKGNAGYKAVVQ